MNYMVGRDVENQEKVKSQENQEKVKSQENLEKGKSHIVAIVVKYITIHLKK